MRQFELNKLVRDEVFQKMLDLGQKPDYRVLEGQELLAALKAKLIEETEEFDPSQPDISELADVQEALDNLVTAAGFSSAELAESQQQKFVKAGGYAGRFFVSSLVLADNDEWVSYYADRPDRFPETSIE
jgi:predicted house-cleaning noncanonical NTP pyrophosphatase (MazG superfamily)